MLPITLIWLRDYDSSNGMPQFSKTTIQIHNLEPVYKSSLWKVNGVVSAVVTETSSFEFSRTREFTPKVTSIGPHVSLRLPGNLIIQLNFTVTDVIQTHVYIGKLDNYSKLDIYGKVGYYGDLDPKYSFQKNWKVDAVDIDWHFTLFSECELFT
jgi:hypothetical protein